MEKKFKVLAILIILVILLFTSLLFRNQLKMSYIIECQNISEREAVKIVGNLPEVKDLQKELSKINLKVIFITQKNALNWDVRVAEDRPDHITTFNYYTVDSCSGKITCSQSIYDRSGKLVRYSNPNEYPCD